MSGFVTFKRDKEQGNDTTLRAAAPAGTLPPDNAADYAWAVQMGGGSGSPPSPESTVFFRVDGRYPGSNILRLSGIGEAEYERIKASSNVARFSPYRTFSDVAREAARISR